MKFKGITEHAVYPPPTMEQIRGAALLEQCSVEEAAESLLLRRAKVIAAEENDPLRCGWEPPIWKACDAILGLPCYDAGFLMQVERRLGMDWESFSGELRKHLGFEQPVTMLLVLGGNRSGKSDYAAKRCMEIASYEEGQNIYAFHMSHQRSVNNQQPRFWHYMPPEWKKQTQDVDTYIKYKRKTGFSEGSFINPVGSYVGFLNYSQDRSTAIEGLEANLVAADELIPPDWLETLIYRLATRGGRGIVTFTPVLGYSPAVKAFCDSGKVTRQTTGYCLPKDGGSPDVAAALGLSREELEELRTAPRQKRMAMATQSRPEDVIAWLEDRRQETGRSSRKFEMMPRVMRSANRKLGVVWFHCNDNPYGNPKEVIDTALQKGTTEIKIRVYGKAERGFSTVFPKFSRRVHVVPASAVPTQGTRYMMMDPAADRNFWMAWILVTPGPRYYIYREWPGNYEIPGVGVPDSWAIPSGAREGRNDGARGEAQKSFGFGLLRYKFEIARLEGWTDYCTWLQKLGSCATRRVLDGVEYPDSDELESWCEWNGAAEPIELRMVDSRAASAPRVEHNRPVTLETELNELGMNWSLSPGDDIRDGVGLINSALDYAGAEMRDAGDAILDYTTAPQLYVSDACENTIFSLENWMNADGQKGACKDPIDPIRWLFCAELGYEGDTRPSSRGFSYGRQPSRQQGSIVLQEGDGGQIRFVSRVRFPRVVRE